MYSRLLLRCILRHKHDRSLADDDTYALTKLGKMNEILRICPNMNSGKAPHSNNCLLITHKTQNMTQSKHVLPYGPPRANRARCRSQAFSSDNSRGAVKDSVIVGYLMVAESYHTNTDIPNGAAEPVRDFAR